MVGVHDCDPIASVFTHHLKGPNIVSASQKDAKTVQGAVVRMA